MNVAFFGECIIELSGQPLQRTFGGDTLNTALYLARLGQSRNLHVSYATGLGMDRISESMRVAWQIEHINTNLVRKMKDKLPGLCLIETEANNHRHFHYWRNDSAAKYYFHDVDSPFEQGILNQDYDVLYISGISLAILTEEGKALLVSLLVKHCEHGGKVVFDNRYRAALQSVKQAQYWYSQVLPLASIVLLNEKDEQNMWGDLDIMTRYSQMGCQEVVIQRSHFCSKILTDLQSSYPQVEYVSGHSVHRVIDSSAAIDAFSAGYLAMRLQGQSPRESAELGHQLSTRVIQYPGAIIPRQAMNDLA